MLNSESTVYTRLSLRTTPKQKSLPYFRPFILTPTHSPDTTLLRNEGLSRQRNDPNVFIVTFLPQNTLVQFMQILGEKSRWTGQG